MCLMHQTPRFGRSVFLVDQWLSSATLLTRCVSLPSLLYVCCKWSILKWRIKCAHVYTHSRIQPWTTITAVSSKPCASYSTVQIPLYDGDTFERVVDRIRRHSGIPGKHGTGCCSLFFPNVHFIPLHFDLCFLQPHISSLSHPYTFHAGNIAVNLLRYERDSGEQDEVIGIGMHSHFTITQDKAYLKDPESGCEAVAIGTHLQYSVNVPHA